MWIWNLKKEKVGLVSKNYLILNDKDVPNRSKIERFELSLVLRKE